MKIGMGNHTLKSRQETADLTGRIQRRFNQTAAATLPKGVMANASLIH